MQEPLKHSLLAVQVAPSGFRLLQLPDWQVSPCVHASLSLHAVPSALAGFEQRPVVWSQLPALWH